MDVQLPKPFDGAPWRSGVLRWDPKNAVVRPTPSANRKQANDP